MQPYWNLIFPYRQIKFCFTVKFMIFTARKRSLGQSNIFRSMCQEFCSQGGGVVSHHALQVVSQHALQQVWGGGNPACLSGFQAHTQRGSLGGSGQGGSPGPHPRGKLRGIWPGGVSRPTPGDSAPGGEVPGSSGVCSRGMPSSGGELVWRPPWDSYCCRRYASYWNEFL